MKRFLSLLLCLLLCLALLPAPARAAGESTGWAVPFGEAPNAENVQETTIEVPEVDPDKLTVESVYKAMIAKKADFPEGMHWTNDNFYAWYGGIFYGGYGCAGFAFLLSDAAFGKLPAHWIDDFKYADLRVGDILRVNNDTHSVIILEKNADGIVIAEGNYNSSIHWGRRMSVAEAERADYVLSRWPELPKSYKPEAPYLSLSASAKGKPVLEWEAVDGAAKYQVWRSTTGKAGSFKLVKTTTALKFTNSKAPVGKTCYYKVRAVTEYGVKGAYSEVWKLKVKPAPPVVKASYDAKGKPVLTWKAVFGAEKYQIWCLNAYGEDSSFKRIATVTGTSYTHAKAVGNTPYYYQVRAVAENGTKSEYSNLVEKRALLERPVVTSSFSAKGKPVLSWNDVEGAAKYQIFRSTTGAAGSFKRIATVTGTSFTNAKAVSGTTYYYKVRAIGWYDAKGAFSTVVKKTAK